MIKRNYFISVEVQLGNGSLRREWELYSYRSILPNAYKALNSYLTRLADRYSRDKYEFTILAFNRC